MLEIDSTSELLRGMSGAGDPDELLRLILGHVRRSVAFDRVLVLSREGLQFPLFRVILRAECGDHGFTTRVDDPEVVRVGGLLADLLYAGEFRSIPTLYLDPTNPSHAPLRGSRSLIAFPLFDRGDSVGMVVLLCPSAQHFKTEELCGLAIVGALLQNARRAHALTRELEESCRAFDAELAAAANVQRWLLPSPPPPTANVCVAASYRTAQHAGGDYYDAGELPDGRFGVLIADVSGHDAAAAVLMAIFRTIVHDELDQSPVTGPAALLDCADNRLCKLGLPNRGSFVTSFCGALNTATGVFSYSCAGHPPPRLLRARDRTVAALDEATLLPLGVLEDLPQRAEESVVLAAGDLLVLYSDGITEARSPAGEFFGVTGLDRVLCELPDPVTPEIAVAAIQRAVEEFSGTTTASDDQTLLAVHWHGDDATPSVYGNACRGRNGS
jgi:sigma-B regulation protein RsbU (phosphoserine phosphatase)